MALVTEGSRIVFHRVSASETEEMTIFPRGTKTNRNINSPSNRKVTVNRFLTIHFTVYTLYSLWFFMVGTFFNEVNFVKKKHLKEVLYCIKSKPLGNLLSLMGGAGVSTYALSVAIHGHEPLGTTTRSYCSVVNLLIPHWRIVYINNIFPVKLRFLKYYSAVSPASCSRTSWSASHSLPNPDQSPAWTYS
jgi:hypothetical protein